MPAIINADDGAISGASGLKLSSDTSGALNIQTNGVTAIAISASQAVSFPATTSLNFTSANITTLTSSSATITNLLATTLTVSSVGIFPAGSASSAAITTAGDTNTGIFFPAADTIAFTEGGTEVLRLNSSAQVAVNTAGTAAAPVITKTDDLNTGIFFPAADTIAFTEGGVEAARFDSAGNFGLGVTPSAWGSSIKALEFKSKGNAILSSSATNNLISTNAYFDTAWKYGSAGEASYYAQDVGTHSWYTAPSGSANAAITFTRAMTLDASGNLIVGGTSAINSAAGRGNITINGSSNAILNFGVGGAEKSYIYYTGTDLEIYNTSNNAIKFGTNNTERARITSAGNLGIGTTSPSYRLQVQKTAIATPAFMIGGGFFGGPRLQVYGLDDNGTAWMGMGTDMSTGIYELSIYYPNASGNGRISFGTYNGTTYTERMSLSQAGNLNVVGALSKGSGSFRIPHPLKEETHDLVHSFIEGPQADLIYSGKVQLEDGVATVNIDAASGMTEGTFVVLCRDIRCFTNNETDWDNVRGKVIGNLLTIECQNPDSDAVISWMVIGERQDKHMYDTDWTDADGKVIVEPLKPVIKKSYN